jgi:hypothetical protein
MTPAAVSAVRGTQYRISAAANPSVSRIEVVAGLVSVSGRGKTRLVPDKFGTVVRINKPPETPVRLLPPPNISILPPIIERVPIPLNFSPLSGAVAYRAQIAPDTEFKTLLFDGLSDSSQVRGPILPDGDYVLRVRGIDSKGLEGLDTYHRFTLNARPEPPTLVAPKYNAVVLDKLPLFQWSEPQKVASYHFQLADDEQFSHVLIDIPDHPKSSLDFDQSLPFTTYYWRVATLSSTGEKGPFSDPQRFRLQAASKVAAPIVAEDSIMLRWSAGLPDQRYQIQLAKDLEFAAPVIDTTVSEPQTIIHYPDSGFYYLRIRTIDVDNSPGPYSPVQRITVPARSYLPLFTVFTILVIVLAL